MQTSRGNELNNKIVKILERYGKWVDGSDYSLTKDPFDTEVATQAIQALITEQLRLEGLARFNRLKATTKEDK